MRILHIGEYVQGGVATYIKTLICENRNEKIENFLICSAYKSEHNWPIEDKYIHYYPYKRSILSIFRASILIKKYVEKIKPDIIYCHSSWAGLFGRLPLLFYKRKFKVVYNPHGWAFIMDIDNYKKWIFAFIEKFLLRVTDKVINVSQFEYNNAIKYNLPSDKLEVIISGISDDRSRNDIKILNNDDNCIIVLYVGRFDKAKGVDILLEAFSNVMRTDVKLYLIGDGVLESGDIKNEYTNKNIFFLGWIPHDKLSNYYASCDVVIVPSRWEAFGLVCVEAMRYSKPVIVSNRGALPELVQNDVTGMIFDLNSTNQLTDIINKLDKGRLKKMGKQARKKFEGKFTASNMCEKTYILYKQIVATK